MLTKPWNSGSALRTKIVKLAIWSLAALLGSFLTQPVMAQSPTGGTVTSGTATITQSGNTTDINQSSSSAVINWTSFSIGSSSTVDFNQPSSTSVTLNRVTGTESSVIEGVLNATGYVFLINGNGILMTKGSSVNTAGFVASTLDINDDDFKAGKYTFQAASSSPASVINMGTITAKDGGYVALMGGQVSNQGVIVANKGTVAMAAGDQVTLNFNGNSLVGVTVDQGTLDALVENKQAIYANGGTVILTAKSADGLLNAQVNNSGLIEAETVGDVKGDIQLLADGGTVSAGGTLDASAPTSGDGGTIETSGNSVVVDDNAVISTIAANGATGTWLIDPDGFTIANTGGDITGTTLSKELATTNVTISSTDGSGMSGNLVVDDTVSWSANTTLSLKATNDIDINSAITATGANAGLNLTAGNDINVNSAVTLSGENAALTMNYGDDYTILTTASYAGTTLNGSGYPVAATDTSGGVYGSITLSGDNASLTMNGQGYTLIHSMSQLDALDGYDAATGEGTASTVSGYYAIAQNLDASGTTYTNALIESFSGTLAGLGHTISNLTIDAPTGNDIALIGYATNSTLRDLGLTNVNITGASNVGALLGDGETTGTGRFIVEYDYSTGSVTRSDPDDVGGFYAVGGLIGALRGGENPAIIDHSYSTADVTSGTDAVVNWTEETGGLVGYAYYTTIENSHASGDVTSVIGNTGGLVGYLEGANSTEEEEGTYAPLTYAVVDSYATGDVTETSTSTAAYATNTGGLIGIGEDTNVYYSFATGNVTGYTHVGGLIGKEESLYYKDATNYAPLTVYDVYATGNVTGVGDSNIPVDGAAIGGLIGSSTGANVTDSFATGNVTSTYYADDYSSIYIGGLIGAFTTGTVSDCYATGDVSAVTTGYGEGVGGLVGSLNVGLITDSYATGDVSGAYMVGGLVGIVYNGVYDYTGDFAEVLDSIAYGNVYGNTMVGGVAGVVGSYGNITGELVNDAAYSDVKGLGDYVGGIAGYASDGTLIAGGYSFGSVEGADDVGGIVGNGDTGDSIIVGSYSYGNVKSDVADAAVATSAANTMSGQTGDYSMSDAEGDSGATQTSNADQLDQNLIFDDSNYTANIRTVIVDGVEYQVNDDSAAPQQQDEKKKKEKK